MSNCNEGEETVKQDGNQEDSKQATSEDDTTSAQSESNDSKDEGTQANSEKTFTQDDVNRMMTKEKKQGRSSVYNELGLDPNNLKMIAAAKAFFLSLNAESGSDADAIGDATSANDIKDETLEHDLLVANAKVSAMKNGADPQYVDDIVTLVEDRMKRDDDLEFDSAVSELKKKYPQWFVQEQTSKTVGQHGTGSNINASSSMHGNDSLGRRLAARRKSSNSKTSYWKN